MEKYTVKDDNELINVIHLQKQLPDVNLGGILVGSDIINQAQLDEALLEQQVDDGKHLGRILIEMGIVSSEQVNYALARKFGIPFVRLTEFKISSKVLGLINADLAFQYNIIPLVKHHDRLIVAMENPLDLGAIEALRFNTNLKIESVMATAHDIALTLSKYYSKFAEDEAMEDGRLDLIGDNLSPLESSHLLESQAKKKPIVRLLNAIILQGVIRKASDINIRPERDRVNVFYRVDGKLQFSRALNRSLLAPLVSRVKVIGKMDISERRLPHDGHARLERDNRSIDFRISIIPTVNGESVVIRILDKNAGLKQFSELGFTVQQQQQMTKMMSKPNGLLLVTGPTGAGKSTTLYALLNEIKKSNPHILTVEDPVEYEMEGVEQVQILPSKGFGFAETLRHFLRHDPDVIMVGEIRDNDTAALANKAALTGHLVLSTLHTNDAASAIIRLVDMDVEPYLLGSTLLGVIAQRLVRLNCSHCLEADPIDANIRQNLGLSDSDQFVRGGGCSMCNYTGYQGRTLVSEVLVVTNQIAELINAKATTNAIVQQSVDDGMKRLMDSAINLAKAGKTSIEEVIVIRD